MTTENQLLPCPFCGEEPHDAHHIEYGRWAVTCQCGVHGASASTGPNATDESKIKAYTDARAAWNARAALTQPAQPAEGGEAVAWTPGANEFKDWCSNWFGPDSDEQYLSRAVFDLPPMAQRFAHTAPPASQKQAECKHHFTYFGDHQVRRCAWCNTPESASQEQAQQPSGGEVVAWRLRIGDSPDWSFCTSESDADFYGKQSGMRYTKQPLTLATPKPEPMTDEQHEALMRGRSTLAYGRAVEARYGITKEQA